MGRRGDLDPTLLGKWRSWATGNKEWSSSARMLSYHREGVRNQMERSIVEVIFLGGGLQYYTQEEDWQGGWSLLIISFSKSVSGPQVDLCETHNFRGMLWMDFYIKRAQPKPIFFCYSPTLHLIYLPFPWSSTSELWPCDNWLQLLRAEVLLVWFIWSHFILVA